jgi:5-methylcytosine-specific restriction endonuclease McrA
MRRPGFSRRNLWQRDGGVCPYTGRNLAPYEDYIDHVILLSRGCKTSWDNCVLAHREINSRKAHRSPQEAGLRLRRPPAAPKPLPATALIRNLHGMRDWEVFLG